MVVQWNRAYGLLFGALTTCYEIEDQEKATKISRLWWDPASLNQA